MNFLTWRHSLFVIIFTNQGTVLPSPYPAFVTVSIIGRPESESMAMWTLYPKTYFSRWWSLVHDASLSLLLWCLHCLLSWSGLFAYLQSLNHAQMTEESRLTVSPVMTP